ncbi:hypothetical protein ABI59_21070 [Acidobacteria bacterium Mor1]|nr:hypothetical protein ABI59_21070 [Acidobacteria bacterium Mor1]
MPLPDARPLGVPLRAGRGLLLATVFCAAFSISLMQTLLPLAILCLWVARRGFPFARGSGAMAWSLTAFAAMTAMSALAGPAPFHGLRSLTEFSPFLLIWFAADAFAGREHETADALLIGAALSAMVGLSQSLEHGLGYRIHGTLPHYMTFAGVMALALLASLPRVLTRPIGWRGAALLPIATALLLTQTRSAWLGVIAGALIALIATRPRWLWIVPAGVIAVALLAPGPVRDRARSFGNLDDPTWVNRLEMGRAGLQMIQEHPLLGSGPRRLPEAYPPERAVADPTFENGIPPHLHNNLLQLAAERGLPALLAWAGIWIAWLGASVSAWRRGAVNPAALAGSLAAVAGFHLAGLFEYTYGDAEIFTPLCVLMAVPFAGRNTSERAHPGPS